MIKRKTKIDQQHPEITFFYFSDLFSNRKNQIPFFILTILTFVIFWQTTAFEFVWDDIFIHLVENPHFNPPLYSNLIHFWHSPYEGLYIPIPYTLWGIIKIMGFENPPVYHFANIFLHALNGILVFMLLRQFIKSSWAAMAGALLFIVHPLQVETVTWVSEFRGLLASSFCFSSLYFYIRACHEKYIVTIKNLWLKYWTISWILFLCAILSKPSAVVMPLFAILFEYYLHRSPAKKIAANIWIFFIPVFVITIITSSVQSNSQAYPFWSKPLIWMDAVAFYLYKLFIPFSLAASYARTPSHVMSQWWFYIIWILPVCLGVFFWHIRKNAPLFLLSALLFIIGFLPTSGLLEFTFQKWSTVADRYLYLSMMGVALFIGLIASHINKKWQWGILFFVIFLLAGQSGIIQIKTWKNSFTLWNHCITITPTEHRAFTNRGRAYAKREEPDKAFLDYSRAISMCPDDATPYKNRGAIYALKKDFYNALLDFNTAISLKPGYSDAYYSRGLLHAENDDPQKALSDYSKAISINPNKPEFYSNRGIIYGLKNEFSKSISDFNMAISINPNYAEAYLNKAVTLFYMKHYKEAFETVKKSQHLGQQIPPAFLKDLKSKINNE